MQNKIDKQKILGQFFTKETTVEKLLDILLEFKKYNSSIKILEPSFGTGNFIKVLKQKKFSKIYGCEIDPLLAEKPEDFFNHTFSKKYDLIIGNPPFSKYNLKKSYCHIKKLPKKQCKLTEYLPNDLLKKDKEKIENIFILKSIKHLKNKNSSIGFILPISFFIKNKNKVIKNRVLKTFSTIIIFQNKEIWFDYNIPCCFAIFTNIEQYKNKIILVYENKFQHKEIINIDQIHEELIPEVFYNKKNSLMNNGGKSLQRFLEKSKIEYRKSFEKNNISGKNILKKYAIPARANIGNYKLAIVRVGNGSIGKAGLINVRKDILNDMFYVFDFVDRYNKSKKTKEDVCRAINKNQNYFKSITCRVGSKSIKKEDVLDFKVNL